MKQQALVVAMISLITILFCVDLAQAGRKARSRANWQKANAWCIQYSRANDGAECRIKKIPTLCPKGFTRAARFNRIRSVGYKTCIPGKKIGRAGHEARTEINRKKANAWCAEYSRTHGGEECRVNVMMLKCPRGFRQAKRFKTMRSEGYKSCIPGKKRKVLKKAIKNIHKPLYKPTTKPVTNRVDRSKENHRKARAWCAEYSRTHGGAECRVKRMIRNCPTGLPHIAKRFKQFRGRGYKTCIRE